MKNLTKTHRYELAPYQSGYKNRYQCPKCTDKHSFSRYIDTVTGRELADYVGKCEHDHSCEYHYTPSMFFNDNPHAKDYAPTMQHTKVKETTPKRQAVNELPQKLVSTLLSPEHKNNLYTALCSFFDGGDVAKAFNLYKIGAATGSLSGSTVFFQVDSEGKFRGGKIVEYDSSTAKRIKNVEYECTWVHSFYKNSIQENYELRQCLFGQHLLSQFPQKQIALVESEKTALIGSIVMPEYVWLATGGANNNMNAEALDSVRYKVYPNYAFCFRDNDRKGIEWENRLLEYDLCPHIKPQIWWDKDTPEKWDIADLWLSQIDKRSVTTTPLSSAAIDTMLQNDFEREFPLSKPKAAEIDAMAFRLQALEALALCSDRFSYTEAEAVKRLGSKSKFDLFKENRVLVRLNTSPTLWKLSDATMDYYN